MNLDPPESPPGKPHTAVAWTSSGCERWPRAPLVAAKLSPGAGGTRCSGEGGRRGSRWREGSPAGPGVQRRRRARLVCACVCVSLGNCSGDRLGPDRPSAWAAGARPLRSALGPPGGRQGCCASLWCSPGPRTASTPARGPRGGEEVPGVGSMCSSGLS